MDKLAVTNIKALQAALDTASIPKATKCLMIAIVYADDVPVETLSGRYNILCAMIYSWLDRFEHQSIADARTNLGPKFDDSQQERLAADLAESLVEHRYDAFEWSPKIARPHIERVFGVTYSLGHSRRLLQRFQSAS